MLVAPSYTISIEEITTIVDVLGEALHATMELVEAASSSKGQ